MEDQSSRDTTAIWAWLCNEQNRKILTWIGSGAVALISGLWIAYHSLDTGSDAGGATTTAENNPPARKGNVTVISNQGVASAGAITIQGDVNNAAPPPSTK